MVAGHLAFGLAVNGRRPTLPLAACLVAATWPDLVMAGLGLAASSVVADTYSHSLPAIGTWALLAGLGVGLARRSAVDGRWVAGLVVSHLPADWVTSRLALWPGGPQWGADLYARPDLDFVLEAALAVVAWAVYRGSLPTVSQRRALAWAPLIVLLLLQGVWAGMSWG